MNSTTSIPVTLIDSRTAKPFACYAATGARVLLGLVFLVFGLNKFFNFIPPPSTPMPDRVMAFIGAMMTTYLLPLIAGTEVLVGALLLANRFVPLALLLLAPVVVNIVAFHLFLEPAGLVIAMVVLAFHVYLLWTHRSAFRAVLTPRS